MVYITIVLIYFVVIFFSILLKFKILDQISINIVPKLTQYHFIYTRNLNSIFRILPELEKLQQSSQKLRISKNLNASIEFVQI